MKRPAFLLAAAAVTFAALTPRARAAGTLPDGFIDDLVTANRIIANQGVVDGFGHVSVRSPLDPTRFYLAKNVAPGLVVASDILEYDLTGTALDSSGARQYLERFIHAAVFAARPDVNAVVHSHSPSIVPFSVSNAKLRPLYHMAGFLGDAVPVFEIRDSVGSSSDLLIRNMELGRALAKTLGKAPVALLRGHGMVVVGSNVKQAGFRSVYTETNAHLESEALRLGNVTYLTPAEANSAATTLDGQVDRPWEIWKREALKP